MRKKTARTGLMTEGSIGKHILLFSIPLILGNLLQQTYNTADSIIVGNFVGSNALAAVGSSAALINLLIAFSMGAAVGAGVVVSQFLGAGDEKGVHRSVHTALAMAVILGIALLLAGVLLTPQILKWMGTPGEIMGDSVLYLRLYSFGLIFNVVYNMSAGILNAVGRSERSLMYLGTASVTNIILDLVMIRGMGMGVEGAAVATAISQAVSCVLALSYLCRVPESYRVTLHRIRLERAMAGRIIQVGLPAAIQNMVISFSNVLIQFSVNSFGAKAMAGFGAYIKVDGFNFLPVTSFSMAATTFVGQNYGAGKIDRVKKGLRTTILMGIAYTICSGVLLLVFSHQVIGLFTSDRAVIDYGVLAIWYLCPFYPILSIMYSEAGAIRGTGRTVPPMVILLVAMCLFRILWVQMVMPHFTEITGIYVLYPVSWVLGVVMMSLYTWKGKWMKTVKKQVVA